MGEMQGGSVQMKTPISSPGSHRSPRRIAQHRIASHRVASRRIASQRMDADKYTFEPMDHIAVQASHRVGCWLVSSKMDAKLEARTARRHILGWTPAQTRLARLISASHRRSKLAYTNRCAVVAGDPHMGCCLRCAALHGTVLCCMTAL